MNSLDSYKIHRNILCIDLKSFYATVECVLHGLDPFTTPLAVADASRGGGSIVLAVSPYLKSKGVPSRCRIHEIPKDLNVIFAKPRMQKYLEYSAKVVETYLEYVSDEDLYIYSIDEVFLDVTNYLTYYKKTDLELAKEILAKIHTKLGLYATCGIGENMLMAKLAMDIEAKKNPDFIAKWTYDSIKTHLWPVRPLSKMWSIGHRMEKKLNDWGMYCIGDIANWDPLLLKKKYGILGEELWYHTHGIDMSNLQDKGKLRTKAKSYGSSQVLFRDYQAHEVLTIILEMVDDITRRLRIARKKAKTVTLSVGYSREFGTGFSRQMSLDQATHNESIIYKTCVDLFDAFYEGLPIRMVGIHLSNLTDARMYQYSLFEDADALEREYKLQSSLDHIKQKFGKNSVTRLASEEEHATAKQRNEQIGGHHV